MSNAIEAWIDGEGGIGVDPTEPVTVEYEDVVKIEYHEFWDGTTTRKGYIVHMLSIEPGKEHRFMDREAWHTEREAGEARMTKGKCAGCQHFLRAERARMMGLTLSVPRYRPVFHRGGAARLE